MRDTNDVATPGISVARMLSIRTGGALSLLLFLLARPYTGIKQDAQLYIGFALAKLDPHGIGRDLLFTADGQSGYSMFPPMLLEVVELLGPSSAAMTVAFVGLVVWYFAFRQLAALVFPEQWTALQANAAAAASFALSAHYGGTGVFRFAEPYATPRLFAEALVLGGMAMLLRRSRWFAVPLTAATLIHPLMSLPAVAAAVWIKVPGARQRAVLVGAALLVLSGVIAGTLTLHQHAGPLGSFSPRWLDVLHYKRSLVFLTYWNPQDYARVLVHAVTVAMAARCVPLRTRRLNTATLVVVLLGIGITYVGADLSNHILITQVQPWRGTWLLAVLGTLSVPIVMASVWARDDAAVADSAETFRRLGSLLLLLSWIVMEFSPGAAPLACCGLVLWYAPTRWPQLRAPAFSAPVANAIAALMIVAAVGVQAWVVLSVVWDAPDPERRWNLNFWMQSGVPAAIILVTAFPVLLNRRPHVSPIVPSLLTMVLFVLVIFKFDSRTRYQRYVEAALDGYISNGARLLQTEGSAVAWSGADLEPWAFAGRPSWGTRLQGTSAVFSRTLAEVWYARWLHMTSSRDQMTRQSPVPGAMSAPAFSCLQGDSDVQLVRATAEGRATLDVPKLIEPAEIGGPWTMQRSFDVMSCTRERAVR